MTSGDELPVTPAMYSVRLSERARRDIEAAAVRLSELESDRVAAQWESGLFDRVASLAHEPNRYLLIAESDKFRYPVRQVLYRRTPRSAAYRLLYRVREDTPDGPNVLILHVRHGAAEPINLGVAEEIEAQAGDA